MSVERRRKLTGASSSRSQIQWHGDGPRAGEVCVPRPPNSCVRFASSWRLHVRAQAAMPPGWLLPQRRAWPEQLRRHHGALERQTLTIIPAAGRTPARALAQGYQRSRRSRDSTLAARRRARSAAQLSWKGSCVRSFFERRWTHEVATAAEWTEDPEVSTLGSPRLTLAP